MKSKDKNPLELSNHQKKIIKINCDLVDFFNLWLDFTKPVHKLAPLEMKLISLLLLQRYSILCGSSEIDVDLDADLLSNTELRKELANKLGITKNGFNVIMSSMRKKGVINEGRIDKRIIPELMPGTKSFSALIHFNINTDLKQQTTNNI
jgi:hypothetical protein